MKIQEKYEKQGLVVIAPHVGVKNPSDTKESILARLKKMNVNFSVFGSGSITGNNKNGIPQGFIFSHTGELVFEGHPSDGKFKKKIEDLMKTAPDFLTRGKEYTKLSKEAKSIKQRKSLGKTLKALEDKMNSDDSVTKEEATELHGILSKFAGSELAKIEGKKETAPNEVIAGYKMFSKTWKGSSFGEQASKTAKALKKDKDFQKELKAFAMIKSLDKIFDKYNTTNSDKKKKKLMHQLMGQAMGIGKKYGDTQAFQKLKSSLEAAGIKLP